MSGYVVGEAAGLAVYVEGTVEAVTDDAVTIAGHVLPRRIGDGVHTLSTSWPDSAPDCDRRHYSDCDGDCYDGEHSCDDDAWRTVAGIDVAVERAHDDARHPGPWRYCLDPICRAVRDASQ